jgi:hypothetical protein
MTSLPNQKKIVNPGINLAGTFIKYKQNLNFLTKVSVPRKILAHYLCATISLHIDESQKITCIYVP